jgi:hypothetical protein
MHSLRAGHDTPSSSLFLLLGGRGIRSIDQRDPFHRSASGTSAFPATALPTAVHARREEHATPFSELLDDPAGLGVGSMRQRAPFHRWASVAIFSGFTANHWALRANGRRVPLPSHTTNGPELPTAVQAVPEVHDTLWS